MGAVMISRFLREPLLHFLVAGAAIFGLFLVVSPDDGQREPTRIVVDSNRIMRLSALWQRARERPPTVAELKGLVDDYVKEEIYYREALALGLDRNDTIIRRRLRQKMEFLTLGDTEKSVPSDKELRSYMTRHAARYADEPKASFQQIFLSLEKRGPGADQDAKKILSELGAQGVDARAAEAGDPTQLPADMPLSSKSQIAKVFGDQFAGQIMKQETGKWAGPIPSSYGLHVVRIEKRIPAVAPDLETVRTFVERDWRADQLEAAEQKRFEQLSKPYEVVIGWPQTARLEDGGGP